MRKGERKVASMRSVGGRARNEQERRWSLKGWAVLLETSKGRGGS